MYVCYAWDCIQYIEVHKEIGIILPPGEEVFPKLAIMVHYLCIKE